jgi:hypothetical protein
MMTWTIKQISPLARVEIEEDTRHNNDFLLKTSLEEVQSIRNYQRHQHLLCFETYISGRSSVHGLDWGIRTGMRKTLEIKPQVERGIGYGLDDEAHLSETTDYVVALRFEVSLESFHLGKDFAGFEHGDCSFSVRILKSAFVSKVSRDRDIAWEFGNLKIE